MTLWSLMFHHRHGVSHFTIAAEKRPSDDDVTHFLVSEDGHEPDREDEYFYLEAAEVVTEQQFNDIVKLEKESA